MPQPYSTFLIARVPTGTYQIDLKSEQFMATWARMDTLTREQALCFLMGDDAQKWQDYLTKIAPDFAQVLTTIDNVANVPASELPSALRVALASLMGSILVSFNLFRELFPEQAAPMAEAFALSGLTFDGSLRLPKKPEPPVVDMTCEDPGCRDAKALLTKTHEGCLRLFKKPFCHMHGNHAEWSLF